ncbi:MAG: nitrile hydratase subunit alpha, partial [Burkholderiales bacterium]
MPHDHDHPHEAGRPRHNPPRPDLDDTITQWRAMEIAVRELLIEKNVLGAEEIRRQVEDMDSRTPAQGAKVVARAWVD